jgi:hypothetical protein
LRRAARRERKLEQPLAILRARDASRWQQHACLREGVVPGLYREVVTAARRDEVANREAGLGFDALDLADHLGVDGIDHD